MRSLRLFICALALAGGITLLPSTAVFAQSPTPTVTATSTTEPSVFQKANWSKYMAWVLAGIGAAVLGMTALGWLVQGPGFRKLEEEEAE